MGGARSHGQLAAWLARPAATAAAHAAWLASTPGAACQGRPACRRLQPRPHARAMLVLSAVLSATAVMSTSWGSPTTRESQLQVTALVWVSSEQAVASVEGCRARGQRLGGPGEAARGLRPRRRAATSPHSSRRAPRIRGSPGHRSSARQRTRLGLHCQGHHKVGHGVDQGHGRHVGARGGGQQSVGEVAAHHHQRVGGLGQGQGGVGRRLRAGRWSGGRMGWGAGELAPRPVRGGYVGCTQQPSPAREPGIAPRRWQRRWPARCWRCWRPGRRCWRRRRGPARWRRW